MTSPPLHPGNLIEPGGGKHRRLPMYWFPKPRCPFCRSVKLHVRKSIAQGDGSVLRHYACLGCDERFRGLFE